MVAPEERFSIDGSDSDASDATGCLEEGSGDEATTDPTPGRSGNDEARRAHKHKMLALSELMRVTTSGMPEDEGEGEGEGDEGRSFGFGDVLGEAPPSAHFLPGRWHSSSAVLLAPGGDETARSMSSLSSGGSGVDGARPNEASTSQGARFGSVERRALRPNEAASLAGLGSGRRSLRASGLRGSTGGGGGLRGSSTGGGGGLFGSHVNVHVHRDADVGGSHTDIARLVNFE
jgi:hypothetical protein